MGQSSIPAPDHRGICLRPLSVRAKSTPGRSCHKTVGFSGLRGNPPIFRRECRRGGNPSGVVDPTHTEVIRMNSRTGLFSGLVAVLALLAFLVMPHAVSAQQTGTIEGTVTDARTGALVGSAQVSIVGTQRGTLAGTDGRYRIANVTAGEVQIRATFIGYRTQTQTVTLQPGQTLTVDFALEQTALALDEILVTGTAGRQDRRAQSASIASIDASALTEVAPISSVANLLQGRTSGVSITSASGTSGATQRIRLRGSASIVLSNEPIVIIDGIRMDSRQNQLFGVGGQAASRLNDINPDDIESIEIVKGPAAATLYGADASAGVIQIRTKRGAAGQSFQQTVSYEFGQLDQNWTPPANFGVCSPALAQTGSVLCEGLDAGTPVSDNPLAREGVFRTGQAHSFPGPDGAAERTSATSSL